MEAGAALPIEAEELARLALLAYEARRRLSRTERVWGYHTYESGEELGRIDWKQSARSERILVREAEPVKARPVLLFAPPPAMGKRGALLMGALGFMLIRAERPVGWLGSSARLTRTSSVWRSQLAALPEAALPPEKTAQRAAMLVLAGDASREPERWAGRLIHCARQGFQGLVIDLAAADLPPLRDAAQTIGWPLLKDRGDAPPEKTLLAAFAESVDGSA